MCAEKRTSRASSRGLTLVELLVAIAIIAILVSMLLPTAAGALSAARSFKCQANQRTSAFDFQLFADDQMHGDRGHDAGQQGFRLDTFQESQYCIDEFWCWPDEDIITLPDAGGHNPMRCPEVSGPVTLRRYSPCTGAGVGPRANISFGFNIWLFRPERTASNGSPMVLPIFLTEQTLLNAGPTPLMWDVDGLAAARRGINPVFTGPSLDSRAYANDRYWFPGARHRKSLNVAFTDGHVESTSAPLDEPTWRWKLDWIR